jgi:hypothetical protein
MRLRSFSWKSCRPLRSLRRCKNIGNGAVSKQAKKQQSRCVLDKTPFQGAPGFGQIRLHHSRFPLSLSSVEVTRESANATHHVRFTVAERHGRRLDLRGQRALYLRTVLSVAEWSKLTCVKSLDLNPEEVPAGSTQALAGHQIKSFSIINYLSRQGDRCERRSTSKKR